LFDQPNLSSSFSFLFSPFTLVDNSEIVLEILFYLLLLFLFLCL
jgi:hypothetical protein